MAWSGRGPAASVDAAGHGWRFGETAKAARGTCERVVAVGKAELRDAVDELASEERSERAVSE